MYTVARFSGRICVIRPEVRLDEEDLQILEAVASLWTRTHSGNPRIGHAVSVLVSLGIDRLLDQYASDPTGDNQPPFYGYSARTYQKAAEKALLEDPALRAISLKPSKNGVRQQLFKRNYKHYDVRAGLHRNAPKLKQKWRI